jgi:hypothetical protein
MANFTQGMWTQQEDNLGCKSIISGDTEVCYTVGLSDEAEDQANANLITSAPDLYDALDPDTLEVIAEEINCFAHSARAMSLSVIARKQRAALAKADGKL